MKALSAVRCTRSATAAVVFATVLAVSCTGAASPPQEDAAAAGSASNEEIARRLVDEAWNTGEFAVIDEVVAENRVSYTNGVQDSVGGPAGLRQSISQLRQEYPDAHLQIDDIFSAGDDVAMRWTFHGTHGQIGREVTLAGVWVGRFAEGKLVEEWNAFDNASALVQLGGQVIEPTAPTSTTTM